MTDSDHYERAEAMEMAQDEREEMQAKLDAAERRIDRLEASNAAAAKAVDALENIGEQAKQLTDKLRTALRLACEWIESSYEDQRTSGEPLECPHTRGFRSLLSPINPTPSGHSDA